MKLDRTYLTETMRRLIETPSPVGYYEKMKPLMEELAAELREKLERYILESTGVSVISLVSGQYEESSLHSFDIADYTALDIMVDAVGNVYVLGDDNALHGYAWEDILASNIIHGEKKLFDCTPFYHQLHIAQLKVMYDLFGDDIYREYAERWEGYRRSFWKRSRAFIKKAWQKIAE